MSNCSRPQVGQAISTGPRSRSFSALRISQATLTSSSAWKVESEMRIVSPMPSASSVPRPDGRLERARPLGAGLGDAEVQRVVDLLREQPVRGDRVRHVRRLDRDLEVVEAEPVHQLDVLERGRHERLDRVLALQLVQVLGQRARVDADPHRHARRARLLDHLAGLLEAADVAGVDADAVRAGVDRLERQRVVEVDVGDHRDRRLLDDPRERAHVVVARNRAADEIAARVGDRVDLLHRRVEVGGLRLRHRLHGDGSPAADLHATDVNLALGGHCS